jgi:glycosyltransferase involved in cell wall biosynthesis
MVCGEESVFSLLDMLVKAKDNQDKIIVIDDNSDEAYIKKLRQYPIKLIKRSLNKDYAAQRNAVIDATKTDYLFMIDADESPSLKLLTNLKQILADHLYPDALWVGRVNRFKGIKPRHALAWGWTLQGEVANFPDPQLRIIKLRQGIRYYGRLHERPKLNDRQRATQIPLNIGLELYHDKTIEQQIKANEFYNANFSMEQNGGLETKQLLVDALPT